MPISTTNEDPMPEPLRKTGDIPRYDTYPAPSPAEPEEQLRPGYAAELEAGNNLNTRAERIGNAVGSAVGAVRQRLQVVPRRIDQAKERLSETGEDVRADVRAAATELKENAQRRLSDARSHARRFATEKPIHVIGTAALLGFGIGAGLRFWRSNK